MVPSSFGGMRQIDCIGLASLGRLINIINAGAITFSMRRIRAGSARESLYSRSGCAYQNCFNQYPRLQKHLQVRCGCENFGCRTVRCHPPDWSVLLLTSCLMSVLSLSTAGRELSTSGRKSLVGLDQLSLIQAVAATEMIASSGEVGAGPCCSRLAWPLGKARCAEQFGSCFQHTNCELPCHPRANRASVCSSCIPSIYQKAIPLAWKVKSDLD